MRCAKYAVPSIGSMIHRLALRLLGRNSQAGDGEQRADI